METGSALFLTFYLNSNKDVRRKSSILFLLLLLINQPDIYSASLSLASVDCCHNLLLFSLSSKGGSVCSREGKHWSSFSDHLDIWMAFWMKCKLIMTQAKWSVCICECTHTHSAQSTLFFLTSLSWWTLGVQSRIPFFVKSHAVIFFYFSHTSNQLCSCIFSHK